ncbi:uncharacterized protein Dsimw501_GD27851, partial [Drosophila simulans]
PTRSVAFVAHNQPNIPQVLDVSIESGSDLCSCSGRLDEISKLLESIDERVRRLEGIYSL